MEGFDGYWPSKPEGDSDADGGTEVSLAKQVRINAVFNQFKEVMIDVIGVSQNPGEVYEQRAHILFVLAKQLPNDKIFEVTVGPGKWTYFHFACRYRPDHAAQILDNLTPDQLYNRVNTNVTKKASPLRLALSYIEEGVINSTGEVLITKIIERARPEDFFTKDGDGYTDLKRILTATSLTIESKYKFIRSIIERARLEDLIATDARGRTELENIQRSSLGDQQKKNLEDHYLARLNSGVPALPAHNPTPAPSVVAITDPREVVAALIANDDATELDALAVTQKLNGLFRGAVDQTARMTANNNKTAETAIRAINGLVFRVGAVEAALDSLNADQVMVSPTILGRVSQMVRSILPKLDPLHPALETLKTARGFANDAEETAKDMLKLQIGIAAQHQQLRSPFEITQDALKTAIGHFETREDPLGQRMLSIFAGQAISVGNQMEMLDRMNNNTDQARSVAVETVAVMQDAHNILDRLAVDIAELATLKTQRALSQAYDGDGAFTLQALLSTSVEALKAQLQNLRTPLPALEAQLQEVTVLSSAPTVREEAPVLSPT